MTRAVHVIVIGAGFAGLYAIHKLRALGLSVQAFEAGSGVGGTWYWNRYPGARCDSEMPVYQFLFSDELGSEWRWSERYPSQPDVQAYLNFVADRLDLRRDIGFDTRVTALHYESGAQRWTVTTEQGDRLSARYCVTAAGCLSAPQTPEFPGIDSFAGRIVYTSSWPEEGVDLRGKRVAVIGTGATGIQLIPEAARDAAQLTVFQRTANFSVPARNRSLTADEIEHYRSSIAQYRDVVKLSDLGHLPRLPGPTQDDTDDDPAALQSAFRTLIDMGGNGMLLNFPTMVVDERINALAADVVRERIRAIVDDPATAEDLIPTDHPIGTKRVCIDTDYFETFNRDNVRLVNLRRMPITRITQDAIVTGDERHPVDIIILATGFDAVTGPLTRIDIRGRDGVSLRDKWADGPKSYLGLMVAGFPNLFTITGPLSPSVFTNMPAMIEQHVDWIADCVASLEREGQATIEARADEEEAWGRHARDVAEQTLFTRAASWYMGANIDGKPRTILPYLGGMVAYREKCLEAAADHYARFELTAGQADPSQR